MAMTPLTGMPARTQEQSTFNTNANDFFSTKLPLFVTEANALQVDVNSKQSAAATSASDAATQAGTATTQAGIATTQATLAANWATQLGTPVSGGEFSAKYHAQAAAASAASAVNSPGTQATSITGMTISNVSKSFTLQQTGKNFVVGQWVTIADATNPSTSWMAGGITAFNSGTGNITVNVVMSVGAATLSNWVVTAASAFVETPTFGGRSARTSNTVLAGSDLGKLIDITSGTFTQTFTAAATLGGNWFCHIRNSGTGDITLDPNGSELIDGLTSYVMYPGETRLVTCDGTGFYTIVLKSFYKVFTATGTFVKPPGYEMFSGIKWGAGGGGDNGYGGNGGGCSQFDFPASVIGASQSVTIGGGAAAGAKGGDTTFIFTTQGGGRGNNASEGGCAYGTSNSVAPFPNAAASSGQNYAAPVHPFYGGGQDITAQQGLKYSVYGAGAGHATTAGTSIFGGAGGVGAGDGTAPGGGGGSTGAGARGELRIWGVL